MKKRYQIRRDFTVPGACDECLRMGWATFNENSEVQRCDTCAVFDSDDEALAHALRLAAKALCGRRPKGGAAEGFEYMLRFKEVVKAVEYAADKAWEDPWVADPSPEWLREAVATVNTLTKGAGATTLQIAYEMMAEGLLLGDSTGEVRDNLDRDRLEKLLREAGCTQDQYGCWKVKDKEAA